LRLNTSKANIKRLLRFGMAQADIARALGISEQAVSHHVKRLKAIA
jgi:DNA-binding CsgD family transcriptional regulator